ncbi:MAG TPA: transglutaminase domain-containing protein [Rhodanobacter sp.]|nr:transglutaminase domain-containing protein [Rhodanobacter sp.]
MHSRLPVAVKPRGRRLALALLALLFAGPLLASPQDDNRAVAPIIAQIDAGHFHEAQAAIDRALAQPQLSAERRRALTFQRERMRRILLDFTLDADDVEARVRKQIPDLTDAEFAKWNAAGLFEHQVIDGRTLYFKRSPGNLFRLSPEAVARRAVQTPITDGPMESLNDTQRAIYHAALAEHRSGVLPRRVRMTQTLTVDADAVPAGETVRAWIPYPQAVPGQQQDIRYIASVPAQHRIAPASALQRTVYLEQPAVAGKKTEFSVTYELTLFAQYHAIDPARVTPLSAASAEAVQCRDGHDDAAPCSIFPVHGTAHAEAELAPYLAERPPHIVFTDAMRAFSRKVVGDEKNPYRIAQKLFAAVDKIPWAGAREYSTISNISDYALHAGHADCGQQTLLLMTLLRLNGIPTRWQSGMVFSDDGTDYSNIHDWGYLYLAPYGWVPMDVTTGRLQPGAGDDQALAWFYLGGLDNYRIAFNNDYGRTFVPPKQHFRSDNVDSQRGEVEWRGGNLYFDQWDYGFDWQIQAATQGRKSN